MGGLVIETVRPGVQFTPEAAAAFRRAEAQVLREFGRLIDANSTYRSWATQMAMHLAWIAYVLSGYLPSKYPGHSKAVHPSESFHVAGIALDSDDWRVTRIVAILAENGFIRNRLHVPGENHHFEYISARDKNRGKPAGGATSKPTPAPKPAILKELEDVDKAVIVHLTINKQTTFLLIGATVPGGYRSTRAQETANAWARIYGSSKKLKNQAEFDVALREAKALHASWLAQQKQIHG